MFVTARKASEKVTSAAGQRLQSTAERPPVELLASMPVAMMVTPMAMMMDTKSMYPRMANSAKEGGMATRKRMMAEMTDQTKAQVSYSSTMLIQAIVPVKV